MSEPALPDVRLEGVHCSVGIERPAPGVVVLRLAGHDVGELREAPMQELAKDLARGVPLELFIDARAVRGATIDVSGAWAQWLGRHCKGLARVRMLTGTRFIEMTAQFVRRFAALGDVMAVETEPATFEAALAESLARAAPVAVALWRRLDVPGHDAARLERVPTGWRLAGTAVFRHAHGVARLAYHVTCDRAWHAVEGGVRGWIEAAAVDVRVARTPAGWTVGGTLAPDVSECVDLDFGFTPATNLPQLRRLALGEGEESAAPAAWLDVPDAALTFLPQRYQRRSPSTYWYEAPSAGYAELLEVDAHGFIRHYPGLWEAEP